MVPQCHVIREVFLWSHSAMCSSPPQCLLGESIKSQKKMELARLELLRGEIRSLAGNMLSSLPYQDVTFASVYQELFLEPHDPYAPNIVKKAAALECLELRRNVNQRFMRTDLRFKELVLEKNSRIREFKRITGTDKPEDVACENDADACFICLENKAVVKLNCCGHCMMCIKCTRTLTQLGQPCPFCRAEFLFHIM